MANFEPFENYSRKYDEWFDKIELPRPLEVIVVQDCSVKSAKFRLKRESTIKKVKCKKCGKIFKTNKDTEYCFKCSKTLNKK